MHGTLGNRIFPLKLRVDLIINIVKSLFSQCQPVSYMGIPPCMCLSTYESIRLRSIDIGYPPGNETLIPRITQVHSSFLCLPWTIRVATMVPTPWRIPFFVAVYSDFFLKKRKRERFL